MALETAKVTAERLGFHSVILSSNLSGKVDDVAEYIVKTGPTLTNVMDIIVILIY